ncbi:MAG: hypothetical protein EA357_10570 [Micavibrio sp.]|nr:MAG: hypothetical protein EA357_10570 [Micavibrio sp.]
MMKTGQTRHICFDIGETQFPIRPKMALICQIEDEICGLPQLLQKLRGGEWTLCDLVTLVHIILAEEGASYDYYELGDHILAAGSSVYHEKVTAFIALCLGESFRKE